MRDRWFLTIVVLVSIIIITIFVMVTINESNKIIEEKQRVSKMTCEELRDYIKSNIINTTQYYEDKLSTKLYMVNCK